MSRKTLVLKYQNNMLRLNSNIFLVVIFFIAPLYVSSQTKAEIKKKKNLIEEEIKYTKELLNQTKNNKNKSITYLRALEKQIKNKEELTSTLSLEIKIISKQVLRTEGTILEIENTILKEDTALQNLKTEYSKMIYAEFLKKGNRNNLMFIFSSKNFNQAYKRMSYLKQYSAFRKNQAVKISEKSNLLLLKKEELFSQKENLIEESKFKKTLINSKRQEIESINIAKLEKEDLVDELRRSEKKLRKELHDKEKASKELETKLRKIIEEEIKKVNKKNTTEYALTPEAAALSSDFFANKGKLPWPLLQGVIVQHYGKQSHPVFSSIETFNNGIDIATEKDAIVRAVFDGTISRIFFIKGSGKAVLINHGEYFTVYSGLKDISVKAGEKVLAKEKIGVVLYQEKDNKAELHFEIWKSYKKQDPSQWLFKAF